MRRKRICIIIVACLGLLSLVGCGNNCNAIVKDYSKQIEDAVNSSVDQMTTAGTSIGVSAAYTHGASEVHDYVEEAMEKLDDLKASGCDENEYNEAVELLEDNMNTCYDLLDETYSKYGQ